jgi:VanZ family protein
LPQIHQSFIPGRGTDAEDILGNFAGAVGMQILAAAAIWISQSLPTK